MTLPRLILLIYWLALAIGTHWPRLALPGQQSVPLGLDKWLHVGAFAGLLWLMLRARPFAPLGRWRGRGLCVLVVALYIPLDEWTQTFVPGRYWDGGDLIASYLGLAVGGGGWAFVRWLGRPVRDFVDHARVMSGLTLVSRCFGLVRDWALAFALGFGAMFDAFAVAFVVPNLFRRLFGEGALAGAFVPQYTKLDRDDPAAARRFAAFLLRRLLLGLLAVALIAAAALFVAGHWARPLGPRGNTALLLTAITIWYAPLICAVAILGAMLQVHGRFGLPSALPVILNLALIGTALIAHVALGATPGRITLLLALAVVAAGIVQLLVSRLALRRAGVSLRGLDHRTLSTDPAVRGPAAAMKRQWFAVVFGLAVFQINALLDVVIAMGFSGPAGATIGWLGRPYPIDVGAVAVLGAAARLYEFPLGVFGIAVATAIFPALSRVADDRAAFGQTLRRGLRLTVFIGLPASVGLILVRHPLCRAIYHDVGAIDAGDAARIAWVLLGYAAAVWAYSMNHVLVRAFYAQGRAQTPARVAAMLVALNLALNLTLIWPLGAAGLAWATAACQVLQVLILLMLVRRHVDRPTDAAVWRSWATTAAASTAMGAAVWAWVAWRFDPAGSWPATVGVLGGAVAIGAIAYAAAARLMSMIELRWVIARSTETDATDPPAG